ncbi:MAG: hypothetical protein II949_07810 [Prevotella sp.]|nr:hypothetical protein [Prevotella sp.]
MTDHQCYVSTRWQSASVGACTVPARWLDRASVRENGYDTLALDGPSGWHKACPYTGGQRAGTGPAPTLAALTGNDIGGIGHPQKAH